MGSTRKIWTLRLDQVSNRAKFFVYNFDSLPCKARSGCPIDFAPEGLGQVIQPDGTIVPANSATIVPKPQGGIRTAYPTLTE